MPSQNVHYHALLKAVLLSLLFHAVLSLIFTRILTSTVTASLPATGKKIEALLLMAIPLSGSSAALVVNSKSFSELEPGFVVPRSSPAQEPRLSSSVEGGATSSRTVEVEPLPVVERSAAQEDAVSVPIASEVMPVVQDGLREYRLNLGRKARHFKRYPLAARERGQEGTVVIVVSTSAGMAIPQVSLSHSSGYPLLDDQALEMADFAVRVANLPDSLQGRDFAIDLPIRFSLED